MIILLEAAAGALLFVVFLSLEARRRPEVVVYLVVGLTVLDAVIYPGQGNVPIGPFRPSFGGQDLRLVDVIVPTALAARLLVRGLPRRVTSEGLVWFLFFGWYAFAGVVGIARRQPFDLVLFEGKFVLQTGGVVAVVAGAPLSRLADRALLARTALWFGWPTLGLLPLAAAGLHVAIPGLSRAQIGRMGPDAATMLFTLGVLVLVGTAPALPRWPVVVGGGAMLSAPFVADQRAALVGMIPAVLIVAVAMGGPVWRRRSPVRVAALVPLVGVLLLPVALAAAGAAESGESLSSTPVLGRLDETFGSEQKQESAEIRIDLLREGRRLASERPVVGQGLGQQVAIVRGATNDPAGLLTDFHNVAVDLAVRAGFTGLALFALALTVTLMAAARRWRLLARDVHATLVLAAAAALSGLVLKGLFETIFQKYRLAVLMGLLLGIIASSASASLSAPADVGRRREPQWT